MKEENFNNEVENTNTVQPEVTTQETPVNTEAPVAPVEPVQQAPLEAPVASENEAPKKKGGAFKVILVIILILVIAACLVYYFLLKDKVEIPFISGTTTTQTTTTGTPETTTQATDDTTTTTSKVVNITDIDSYVNTLKENAKAGDYANVNAGAIALDGTAHRLDVTKMCAKDTGVCAKEDKKLQDNTNGLNVEYTCGDEVTDDEVRGKYNKVTAVINNKIKINMDNEYTCDPSYMYTVTDDAYVEVFNTHGVEGAGLTVYNADGNKLFNVPATDEYVVYYKMAKKDNTYVVNDNNGDLGTNPFIINNTLYFISSKYEGKCEVKKYNLKTKGSTAETISSFDCKFNGE